jgi:hypothetical protein
MEDDLNNLANAALVLRINLTDNRFTRNMQGNKGSQHHGGRGSAEPINGFSAVAA